MPVTWKCELCGKEKKTKPSQVGRFCSNECKSKYNSLRLDTGTYKECEICGEKFKTKPSHYDRRRTCSNKCSGLLKVREGKDYGTWASNHPYDKNHKWGGGRRIKKNGYIYVRLENGEEIAEHRLVMERLLGRKLLPDEVIHHKDENKQNNDPSNLQLMTSSEHSSYHTKKRLQEGTHHFLK